MAASIRQSRWKNGWKSVGLEKQTAHVTAKNFKHGNFRSPPGRQTN